MHASMIRRTLVIVVIAASVAGWRLAQSNLFAQAQEEKDLSTANFYGVSACMQCHVEAAGKNQDLALLNEYTVWRLQDRHALAYAVLEGSRGEQISKLMGIKVTDKVQGAACLSCHATTSRPERAQKAAGKKKFEPNFAFEDGVSCDGCHGPAEHWMLDHAFPETSGWRDLTPPQKEAKGMYNLRDPFKRAELCMSCHVGNAAEGKVVTHEMYAAGHPPLPAIEVAGFSSNLPQHWVDLKKTPFLKDAAPELQKAYDFGNAEFQQTKLVLASSSVAARVLADLIANRAQFLDPGANASARAWPPRWLLPHSKNEPKDRWPELLLQQGKFVELPQKIDASLTKSLDSAWPAIAMAQSDCYACHHELKSKSWRQLRGYSGAPGRPQFQAWPFALAKLSLGTDAQRNEFAAAQQQLQTACNAQPFGTPGAVTIAAAALEKSAAGFAGPIAPIDRKIATTLLKRLTQFGEHEYPDYDSARQLTWAFRMIYGDLVPADKQPPAVQKLLSELDDQLGLTVQSKARSEYVEKRRDLTKKALGAKDAKKVRDAIKNRAEFIDPMQLILNQEWTALLEKTAHYDPTEFKTKMVQLSKVAP